MGIPATGKQVKGIGMGIYRVVDGKLAEQWVQEDMFGLMQQLGVIPSPEQAST
jgi:predicted ester cyclase